ncbi:mitochondrial protein C2orf69 homolog [Leptopilina boulardi]|uniref:mitochondrial protein C2orf69 homolog n=1 Tax=Leptopilina boulardi TaxID=63433 RepID=UPI0021F64C6A|nr:mitochondrial protein C2orf69 homolog [Leptopilina boulardi]
MAFKIKQFANVSGFLQKQNDILYKFPLISSASSRILVFFGGDTQDFSENMAKHRDSRHFQEWSLENTAKLIAERFPKNHIFIIRPVRRKILSNAVLNCFDNFVSGDEYGAPNFCHNFNSLLHLKLLLQSLSVQIPKASNEIINNDLLLIGFSKGCVVLNQFLHEFHFYQNQKELNNDMGKFISRIKEIWWLDGGHPGKKDTWITDEKILESFIKMEIDIHVHVTPYEVRDENRPWIRIEEEIFTDILQKKGANIQRVFHFEDQPCKLENHFRVLTEFTSSSQ